MLLARAHGRLLLVPATEDEHGLLSDAESRGRLLLDDAYYPVFQRAVVLPEGLSETHARRLLGLLERAACEHTRASLRRRSFKVIP